MARGRVVVDFRSKNFEQALKAAVGKMKLNSETELYELGVRVTNNARRKSPVDTGRLRNAWTTTPGRDAKGPFVKVENRVKYAWIVENGSRPHEIRPKSKQALANVKTGFGPVARVFHPGTPAQPMIRPALLEEIAAWRPRIVPDGR